MIVEKNDPLFDPTFVPCRDDRCSIEWLHREHVANTWRGKEHQTCPVCAAPVIHEARKWAHCSACPWRVINRKRRKACVKSTSTNQPT